MLSLILLALAFWLVAAAAGAMLLFAALVTPVIFRTLDAETARRLTRALFPVYYLALGVVCLLAAAAAAGAGRTDAALVLAVLAAAFAYARQSMTPRINALKDRALAGDEAAAADFDRAHRTSVMLNLMQLAALCAVAYGLAGGG